MIELNPIVDALAVSPFKRGRGELQTGNRGIFRPASNDTVYKWIDKPKRVGVAADSRPAETGEINELLQR